MEGVLAVDKYFILISWVKSAWVQLFKLIQKSAVSLQNYDLIINLCGDCDSDVANVVAWVEEKAMGPQVSQQFSIELVMLKLNAFGGLAKGQLTLRPFEIGVQGRLSLQFYFS